MESNHRPHAYQACALTIWAMSPYFRVVSSVILFCEPSLYFSMYFFRRVHWKINNKPWISFSLERRWSSRTFWYGYLVTTRLRVSPTLMVWRAVCTRPGNVFTAVCWPAITSNSGFIKANFSLQSELRPLFGFRFISLYRFPLSRPL